MNQKAVLCSEKDQSSEAAMLLWVSKTLSTMIKVPVAVFVLILLAMAVPLQHSFGSTKTLDFSIYPDGSTHIFLELDTDPLQPDFQVNLFSNSIENLIVQDENGNLLSTQLDGSFVDIETFGASKISISYDTHELVSKTGKVWSFATGTTDDFSVSLPKNSVIVGMNTYPLEMIEEPNRTTMLLPAGYTEIDYFFTTTDSSVQTGQTNGSEDGDNSVIIGIGGVIAAIIAVIVVLKSRKNSGRIEVNQETSTKKQFDLESVQKIKPDLRDDDKEILAFLQSNGGKAFESELRKKFLQPKTTMWRAIRRLERQEIIEVTKKDMQNLIKLRDDLEVGNE